MKISIFAFSPDALLPQYQTEGSAGADLHACIKEPIVILPLSCELIATGIGIELPFNYEAQIRSRSGLAFKNQISVLNSPATIDSDYRGEIKVILYNHSATPFTVRNGDRIAQMVIAPVTHANFEFTLGMSTTERGEGGFGSTGK